MGDSITYGYGLGNPSTESYPAQLAQRLGASHTVQNFGVSGATLLENGDKPYWNEAAYGSSGSFDPDVVVVMLGTNDAKPQNWSKKAEFAPNYAELIQHYRSLGALVYVATPPPVYPPGAFDIPPDVVASEVVPLVRSVATDANAPLVDVFTALSGKASNFPDTVHPNAAGAALIADAVQAALDEHGFGGASAAAGAAGAAQGGRSDGGAAAFAGGAGTSAGTFGMGGTTSNGGATGNGGTPTFGGSAGAAMAGGGGAGLQGGAPGASGNTGAGGTSAGGASARGGSAGASGGVGGRAGTGSGGTAGVTAPGASGTSSAAGPSAPPPARDDSGCGCRLGDSRAPGRSAVYAVLGLAFALAGRRRRARA